MDISSLNDSQQLVVKTTDGKILCVAGAGTGKTTTLVHRVAYLISELRINPKNILLLTFTRAAAKSMLDRCQNIEPTAKDVQGGTFHSFGIELIKKFSQYVNYQTNFTIIDEDDALDIIKYCVEALQIKDNIIGTFPQPSVLKNIISSSTNNNISILSSLKKVKPQIVHFEKEIEVLRQAYAQYKQEKGLLDFDDCLDVANRLLNEPEVVEYCHNQYRYIMVDEYQDTNLVQAELIKKLVGSNGNIMVVGDPSQSIYAFRGAVAKNIFDFTTYWNDVRILPLTLNYRSTQEILTFANIFESFMKDRFDRNLTSFNDKHGISPQFMSCLDEGDEAKKICDLITEHYNNNVPLKKQAILVRSGTYLKSIEIELITRKIPYRIYGGIKISKASHVKDLLSFIRIFVNPRNELAWKRLLTMIPHIGSGKAEKIINPIMASKGFNEALETFYPIIQMQKVSKQELLCLYEALKSMKKMHNLEKMLYNILDLYNEVFAAYYKTEWEWRKKDLFLICNLAKNFISPDQFVNALTLDYSIDKVENGSHEKEDDVLALSTIHSAKGLEWDVVYIPELKYGHIPSAYATTEEDFEEEKRIFYVAITRAKNFLYMSNVSMTNNGIVQKSPFLQYVENNEDILQELSQVKTSKITNSKNSNNKKVNICEQKYLLEAQGDKTKISNTAKENNNLILYIIIIVLMLIILLK